MDGGFALILIAALVLSVVLSLLQHQTYNRAVKRMTRAFAGEQHHYLVSGRGKGRLRGAVVVMVVDAISRRIVAAEAMVGTTSFARFKGRPDIIGPLDGVVERTAGPQAKLAVAYALEQYKVTIKGRSIPATPA